MDLRTPCVLVLGTLVVLTAAVGPFATARAADEPAPASIDASDMPVGPAPTDIRSGGVLQESFQYHRQGYGDTRWTGPHAPHSNFARAGGWYGYGFPVQTYRWGWFGAGRYYPRVVWHRGYYDDCCRWAYRQGY
jgi:hypothetical protein